MVKLVCPSCGFTDRIMLVQWIEVNLIFEQIDGVMSYIYSGDGNIQGSRYEATCSFCGKKWVPRLSEEKRDFLDSLKNTEA